MDGRSILPLLRDPTPSTWRRRFLVAHWTVSDRLLVAPTYAAVRTGPDDSPVANMLYVEYEDGAQTPELYDLAADPHQLHSLHGDTSPLRVQQMEMLSERLERLRSCGGGTCQSLEFDLAP